MLWPALLTVAHRMQHADAFMGGPQLLPGERGLQCVEDAEQWVCQRKRGRDRHGLLRLPQPDLQSHRLVAFDGLGPGRLWQLDRCLAGWSLIPAHLSSTEWSLALRRELVQVEPGQLQPVVCLAGCRVQPVHSTRDLGSQRQRQPHGKGLRDSPLSEVCQVLALSNGSRRPAARAVHALHSVDRASLLCTTQTDHRCINWRFEQSASIP